MHATVRGKKYLKIIPDLLTYGALIVKGARDYEVLDGHHKILKLEMQQQRTSSQIGKGGCCTMEWNLFKSSQGEPLNAGKSIQKEGR